MRNITTLILIVGILGIGIHEINFYMPICGPLSNVVQDFKHPHSSIPAQIYHYTIFYILVIMLFLAVAQSFHPSCVDIGDGQLTCFWLSDYKSNKAEADEACLALSSQKAHLAVPNTEHKHDAMFNEIFPNVLG